MLNHARSLTLAAAVAIAAAAPAPASASPDPFLGELMLVGFNYCPRGWAKADGQLLSISGNTALFSLLGTIYGGDGRTTFALPDLRGRSPISPGTGPGLQPVAIGERGGQQLTTLSEAQLPSHSHAATTSVNVDVQVRGLNQRGNANQPGGSVPARATDGDIYRAGPASEPMDGSVAEATATATTTVAPAGGNQPFDNRDPYLAMQWCIALQGIFPSRN